MKPNKYLVLVNKQNLYQEMDFEIVKCESPIEAVWLEKETYDAFLRMNEQIKLRGYELLLESGYRSLEHQQRVMDEIQEENGEEYAKQYVALPGTSEHHTGLALDFVILDNGIIVEGVDMKNHPVTRLVHEIAPNYGFILRYPEGKEEITGYNAEPWHLRFVGLEFAKEIASLGITLEEYLALRKDS